MSKLLTAGRQWDIDSSTKTMRDATGAIKCLPPEQRAMAEADDETGGSAAKSVDDTAFQRMPVECGLNGHTNKVDRFVRCRKKSPGQLATAAPTGTYRRQIREPAAATRPRNHANADLRQPVPLRQHHRVHRHHLLVGEFGEHFDKFSTLHKAARQWS